MPVGTETRMSDFAELVGTAIANAATRHELRASRDGLSVLATQQAALRRVATHVARGASPSEVFAVVTEELARCLHVFNAGLLRFEPDGTGLVVAVQYVPGVKNMPVTGERIPLAGDDVGALVLRTGRAARIDNHDNVSGPEAARIREDRIGSIVGVPVIVDGRLWGAAIVGSMLREPLAVDTEARIGDFADLVATAIANAATRDELIKSRGRIVAAGDETRRRLERNLHDGAQQRAVALGLQLGLAQQRVPPELGELTEHLSQIGSAVAELSEELREISHGLHPAALARAGLVPAIKALARRSTLPVSLDAAVPRRLPESVEVAAYYVVAEALTNAAKHAQASEVIVTVTDDAEVLNLQVRDNGIGGADFGDGSGLIGLKDRVEALGGQLAMSSPVGDGTSLTATIPLHQPG
jgi:signal transduction histidine kinase